MPAYRKVTEVSTGDWVSEGEFHIDCQYYDTAYFIIAHCEDGKYVHEHNFVNDAEAAYAFADRVAERGVIDLAYWGFHEFFSLSLEERFAEEAHHEDLHRRGLGHLSNGCYSEGHV